MTTKKEPTISKILTEIKTAIETIKVPVTLTTKYTVKKNKIDQSLVASTELPIVLVSTVRTVFAKQQFKQVEETYNITLLVLVDKPQKNDNTADATQPIDALVTAQTEIVKALMNQFVYSGGSFASVISRGSFVLRSSSISNTTKQQNFGSAVSCMIEFDCSAVTDYGA